MLEQFKRHLEETGLIPFGSRVLVGYSGGADSTALLHLLKLCEIDIAAAHLHHGQREEAEKELELCQAFADELGIPFVSGRADVPKMSSEMGIGLEEAGRNARYGFFQEAAFRLDCGLVATAHTKTDQTETILLNIVRGTGLHGLAGIPVQRDNIVRPMLPFTREETRAYCVANGFWTHDDPANEDLRFSRARVRNKIVPEMQLINSALDESLSRLSETASAEDRFLNGMAAAVLEQSEAPMNGELRFLTEQIEIRFDRQKLSHIPEVLLKRAFRLACEAVGGLLNYSQTQAAFDGLSALDKGSVTADGGEVVLEWDTDHVEVRRLQTPVPFRYPLTLPGETFSDEFGWQFEAFQEAFDGRHQSRTTLDVSLNAAKITGNLYFRTLQPGDTMQPLGFGGRRKVADILADGKLTRTARAVLPIVCDMVGPIWVPGVCVDERMRCGEPSAKVIRLRFGPLKA